MALPFTHRVRIALRILFWSPFVAFAVLLYLPEPSPGTLVGVVQSGDPMLPPDFQQWGDSFELLADAGQPLVFRAIHAKRRADPDAFHIGDWLRFQPSGIALAEPVTAPFPPPSRWPTAVGPGGVLGSARLDSTWILTQLRIGQPPRQSVSQSQSSDSALTFPVEQVGDDLYGVAMVRHDRTTPWSYPLYRVGMDGSNRPVDQVDCTDRIPEGGITHDALAVYWQHCGLVRRVPRTGEPATTVFVDDLPHVDPRVHMLGLATTQRGELLVGAGHRRGGRWSPLASVVYRIDPKRLTKASEAEVVWSGTGEVFRMQSAGKHFWLLEHSEWLPDRFVRVDLNDGDEVELGGPAEGVRDWLVIPGRGLYYLSLADLHGLPALWRLPE